MPAHEFAAEAGVATIFEAHANSVWRFLRYMGVPDADLPDASQDVFLVVHRRISDVNGSSKAETWLYGICLRVAANRRRSRRRKPEMLLVEEQTAACGTDQDTAERKEARELLLRALDQLDVDQKTVFVLAEVEQLPMKEVARIVGCPLFTAYSRRRLAKKRLRALLTEMEAYHG